MSATDADFLADWAVHCQFGAVEGTSGVDRQAATAVDGQQRKWFADLLESRGFRVERDAIGNQFGLYELVPGAPYVLTGSHLDSQPTAGRFDGAYGVMASAYAAFRVVEQMKAQPREARCNVAVVNWFNEEGSRFKPSMMGSSVFTGKLSLDEALRTTDTAGVSVETALDLIGERGGFKRLPIASYAEIHVEQGRSMEQNGITIGLVNATWGAHKFEFQISGEQAHSGSTLMEDRRDALLGAARLVVAAREIVDHFDRGMLHTAVGEIQVYPNSPVVVASEAKVLLDLRSPDRDILDRASAMIMDAVARVTHDDNVEIEVIAEHSWAQNPYPEEGLRLAAQVASELGLTHDRVMTIAGHDSTNMKDVAPTVMLFVPSIEGISHNVNECTSDEDLIAGLGALTGVVHHLVKGALQQSPR